MKQHWKSISLSFIFILTAFLVSILAFVVLTNSSFFQIESEKEIIYIGEALNFAGIMITIIAFVSAFFLLFLALDAFAFSKDISRNRAMLEENRELLDEQSQESQSLTDKIEKLSELSKYIERQSFVFERIVGELGTVNADYISRVHSQIDLIASKVGSSEDVKKFRGESSEQLITVSRLDALAALSGVTISDHARERAKSAAIELIESARNGSDFDCLLILMLSEENIASIGERDRVLFFQKIKEEDLKRVGLH